MKRSALAGLLASAVLGLAGLAAPAASLASTHHHHRRAHVRAHIALLHREGDRAFVPLPR